jgi:hypothetical protein
MGEGRGHNDRFDYFAEIEEAFIRRRGKPLLLSPLDWALIDEWKKRGIPLHVVLRAIERTFDVYEAQTPRRNVRSLAYCRDEVEMAFAEWLKTQRGRGREREESPVQDEVQRHLKRCREALSKALNAAQKEGDLKWAAHLRAILTQLEELTRLTRMASVSEADLASRLEHLEEELYSALIERIPAKKLEEYRRAIERELRALRLNEEHLVEMRERLLIKRLCEEHAIPRLGLFHL